MPPPAPRRIETKTQTTKHGKTITPVSLLAAFLLSLAMARGQMSTSVGPQAISALAKGDWSAALATMPAQDRPSPVIRALRGHCLLMLNQSATMKRSHVLSRCGTRRSCGDWAAWTATFVDRFPANSIAFVFARGWIRAPGPSVGPDAVTSYDCALKLEPAFAPAF